MEWPERDRDRDRLDRERDVRERDIGRDPRDRDIGRERERDLGRERERERGRLSNPTPPAPTLVGPGVVAGKFFSTGEVLAPF